MNEFEFQLVQELRKTERELATLQTRVGTLSKAVEREEINDANYRMKHDGGRAYYGGTLRTEEINDIMGWNRSSLAEDILRKEVESNGDAERADE